MGETEDVASVVDANALPSEFSANQVANGEPQAALECPPKSVAKSVNIAKDAAQRF